MSVKVKETEGFLFFTILTNLNSNLDVKWSVVAEKCGLKDGTCARKKFSAVKIKLLAAEAQGGLPMNVPGMATSPSPSDPSQREPEKTTTAIPPFRVVKSRTPSSRAKTQKKREEEKNAQILKEEEDLFFLDAADMCSEGDDISEYSEEAY